MRDGGEVIRRGSVAVAWWLAAWLLAAADAVLLDVPATGKKCVSEEIHANVVSLADYSLILDDHRLPTPTISSKVTSPYGNTLYHKENVTADQFAFTTTENGNYLACFWLVGANGAVGASVSLNWRTGIAAKDWDSVARKDKIEGVELELKKLEELVESIHENLLYLKSREADMRDVSEVTNARIAWFSMMSLAVCVAAAVLQLWYLKIFFQKKKLI